MLKMAYNEPQPQATKNTSTFKLSKKNTPQDADSC